MPLHFIVAKLTRFGPFPTNVGGAAGIFLTAPDGRPDWRLRFVTTLLLPRHDHQRRFEMKWNARIALWVALAAITGLIAHAQPAEPDFSKTANPELVGALAKELGATPQQAEGATGALFDAARQRMPAADWAKVSAAVPGMDGLLKAAPATGAGAGGAAAAAAGAIGTSGGSLGSAAAAFSKLGLKPEMVAKAVPILTQYVSKTGGAGVGSLLAGALK
jgi:hypothetical protein